MKITRFRGVGFDTKTQCVEVVEDENGAWVHHDEVQELLSEIERLQDEIIEIQELREN